MSRDISLHAFCSAKGGVGKSTLAVASALILKNDPARVRVPLLIDADLTGTSLADGLRLRAPNLQEKADGTLDLDADPAGPAYSVSDTFSQRRRRNTLVFERGANFAGEPLCIPFLNDALAYAPSQGRGPGDCRIDSLFWIHEDDDGVLYLPSSSLPEDGMLALGWLYQQVEHDRLVCRLCWLLDEVIQRRPDITDIILDLSPGIQGVTRLMIDVMRHLYHDIALPSGYPNWRDRVKFRVNPVLVLTADRNDWLPAIEFYMRYGAPLLPRLNRISSTADEKEILDDICEELGNLGNTVRKSLRSVPYRSELAQLFRKREGSLVIGKELGELADKLGLEVGRER